MPHALVVDDDPDAAASLRDLIAGERFTVAVAHTLREARAQIALQQPDILLLDLRLPDGNGMELLADPQLVADSEVVLCTGHANLETSIQALRLGAADYLVKPINLKQLQGVLSRIMKPAALKAEVQGLTARVDETGQFGHLWGRSMPMKRIYEQISRVAATGVSVFITGESGTGKEVVAQTLHDLSRRRHRPFLAVNCGAISPHLFESEIFGHEKGSFTGAERQHLGFFERASGGTLFLDEITEMPLELQVKLLRVLETGRFMRVGSSTALETDVRIVAATNRLPDQAVSSGKLREDLLYRLNIFPIALPPLRDRVSDIPLLAEHFLQGFSAQEGLRRHFTPEAVRALCAHNWPGNVRELRNAIQRACVMATSAEVDAAWLPVAGDAWAQGAGREATAASAGGAQATAPAGLSAATATPPAHGVPQVVLPVGTSLAEAERALVLATLRHHHHHKERTAAVLGISLKTLYNRLKDYAGEAASPEDAPAD
ncbi:sigma-54-dependent transcriptional regulator [Roseateles sp. BYS87W]|uniref:Sigma-54-dependent transcriptional regulator n=1 Tax=Pelomonas baiyunensis TaxID=3299026 RepID=A0ABW7GUP0_9BURK